MTLSLNEVEMLVLKAARGAGVPLGNCTALAKVARWMAAQGQDVNIIAQALQTAHAPATFTLADDTLKFQNTSAIMAGPVARDACHAGHKHLTFTNIDAPTLLIAYLLHAGFAISTQASENTLTIDILGTAKPLPKTPSNRATLTDHTTQILKFLAAQTYVSATAASRAAGAGAGLTDND